MWGNQRPNSRSRGPILGLGVLALVVLIIIAVVIGFIITRPGPIIGGPGPGPGPGTTTPSGTTPPAAQPASCADVQALVVPGTWESNAGDDPHDPTANPASLMLNVSRPLQERFGTDRVDVYTVPYPAQFARPFGPPEMSYDDSRAAGTAALRDAITATNRECPLTTYVLVGFSQGAVIAGDVANQIGTGAGPVPSGLVLGVGLIADGRREAGAAQNVGVSPAGVGAELSLAGFSLPLPKITMTGARSGGFGDLADRTRQICAPNDGICDAPSKALAPQNMLASVGRLADFYNNPVHAMYNTYVVDPATGITATGWTADWAAELIDGAPKPAHS